METVAFIQLAENYESELHETNFDGKSIKSAKAVSAVAITGAALASGLLAAPAFAYSADYGQGYSPVYEPASCHDDCYSSQSYSQGEYPDYYSQGDGYSSGYVEPYSSNNLYGYDDSYGYGNSYSTSYDYGNSSSSCGCASVGVSPRPNYGQSPDLYSEVAYQPIAHSNSLQVGAAGEIVAALQQALAEQGFYPGGIDGVYGHQTAEAVAQYQAASGLLVDGIAGGQTLFSLGLAGA